jgi:hypothetical protein
MKNLTTFSTFRKGGAKTYNLQKGKVESKHQLFSKVDVL